MGREWLGLRGESIAGTWNRETSRDDRVDRVDLEPLRRGRERRTWGEGLFELDVDVADFPVEFEWAAFGVIAGDE